MSYTNRTFSWDFNALNRFYENYVLGAVHALSGYYECGTAAATATKAINATWFTKLHLGGSLKIKMQYTNTAASGVKLQVGTSTAKELYYNGAVVTAANTWLAGETIEVYYDGTRYMANNVAGGGGSGNGVFDVSTEYPTSGVDGGNTYTLEGALAVLNANLPVSKKNGGMSIKFIQSSDNKYVQYRLMSDTFNTTPANWQGVDSELIAGSKNLAESGAVFGFVKEDCDLFVKADSSILRSQIIGITTNFDFTTMKVTRFVNSTSSLYIILNADGNEFRFPVTFDTPNTRLVGLHEYSKTRPDGKKVDIVVRYDGLSSTYDNSAGILINKSMVNIDLSQKIEDNKNSITALTNSGVIIAGNSDPLRGQLIGVFANFNITDLRVTRFINATSALNLVIRDIKNGRDFNLLYSSSGTGSLLSGIQIYEKEFSTTGDILKVIVRYDGKLSNYVNDNGLLINKSLINNDEYLKSLINAEITRATEAEGVLADWLSQVRNSVETTETYNYDSSSTGDGVSQYSGFVRVDYTTPIIASESNFHVIKFPVQNGDVITTNTSYGSTTWGHILYDSNNAYLAKIRPNNGVFTVENENAAYIAITWKLADVSLNEISAVLYRKIPLSDTVEELDSRVEYIENYINDIPVNHAYKGTAPAGIRNKLLNMSDDVNILLLGDSMTAFTNVGPVFDNAANLPAGCQRNTFTYQLWDAICKNKPQCDRFDSAVNAFTETGTWALSNVAKQNISVNSNTEKGEFSPDNCVYHETAVTNDSVAFSWNLDDYEKLNFVYRISAYDGTTEVTISCTSGKVVVYDRASSQWVEANGYTFSQTKTAATSKSDNVADWLRNIPLKMKRVANATGSVTLTFTNTGTGTMYYWGTERYNFNTVRITNIARGGKHIQLLQGNMADEISYRDIDLIICQLPLWNELKAGGDYNAQWDSRHIAFLDYLKSRSSNFADWQVIVNLYHTQVNDWIGNKNIQFQANGDTTKPKTTLPSWDCEMKTIASLNGYDNNVSVCNLVNEMYNFAQSHDTTMQRILTAESQMSSSTEVDENAIGDFFTVDGVHLSQLGFKFYTMCIVPMMYN